MSILESAIGLLAPPRCVNCAAEGMALCAACSVSVIQNFGERCWRCNALSPGSLTCFSCRHVGGPRQVWIVTDHDNTARDLLSLYKFGHQRAAAEPIARLMAATFQQYNQKDYADYLVVPIPTATSRRRARGFGHAELLAEKIAIKLKLQKIEAMGRLGQSRQLGSKREARLKQLHSSFMVKNANKVAGRKVLLVDDVVTTGGSLIAATQVLRAAGAQQVNALLFAKRL
jgi:ComF family protein